MRYVRNALVVALVMLSMSLGILAQTARKTNDPRNIAPTVGSGGSVGGATGLFTVVDGETLRAGEYTFSAAYSNYDRDPGNVDITEVPLSFQIGLSDYIELFFNTDAYRQIKVNSPQNLSSFYLPNSRINGVSPAALVLTPTAFGAGNIANSAVFRFAGQQPFVQFPFVGGAGGGSFGTLGPVRASSGNGADLFPGIGSAAGGILPGLVLSTTAIGTAPGVRINTSTIIPSYLPDAPFINRSFAESAFNSFTVGAKFRFTGPNNRVGVGLLPFYRFYADRANDVTGFNQLQRGASAGSKRGDIGLIAFGGARLAKWANISANIGYTYTGSVKAQFANNEFTILDRGDELTGGLAVDFPVNKFFQPIGEFRATKYVGGRTPNAFEQDPIDALVGVRIFPTRYFGMSFAYRYNVNQQDSNSFDGNNNSGGVTAGAGSINGVPAGFNVSDDPHGYIAQVFIGRHNKREPPTKPNTPAVINSVTLSDTEIVLPTCPEGQRIKEGATCNDSNNVTIATVATDADGDQLLYQYTVSGGKVTGSGANVAWDLSGAQPGTYTISVGVDDGCGVCGKTETREVRIVSCDLCEPIPTLCPTDLRVTVSPDLVAPGDTVTFTADATLNSSTPTYTWTVSAGDIVSGQGTPSITVKAPTGTATTFTGTVQLGGLDPSCTSTASATAQTQTSTPQAELIDDYNRLKPDQEKSRLDAAAARLNTDPNAKLYVIGYGSTKGGAAEAKKRIDFAVRYLTGTRQPARGIDPSRIITINGGGSESGPRTQIYFVPAGATEPTATP